MKVKLLGTAACEGVPAMFCNCENCVKARELGGKNYRARTQALIDSDMLIDFGGDTYSNAKRFNVDLTNIKYFLITHTDHDHFIPQEFYNFTFGANKKQDKAYLLGSYDVKDEFVRIMGKEVADEYLSTCIEFIELKAYQTTVIGDYKITPLDAYHKDGAFVYIIEKAGKALFYCLDTGKMPEQNFEFMKTLNKPFDRVLIDCSYGRVPADKYGGHLSLYDGVNQIKKMTDVGAVDKDTKIVLTHFAHWHIPSHEEMEKLASEFGYTVSYDGAEYDV